MRHFAPPGLGESSARALLGVPSNHFANLAAWYGASTTTWVTRICDMPAVLTNTVLIVAQWIREYRAKWQGDGCVGRSLARRRMPRNQENGVSWVRGQCKTTSGAAKHGFHLLRVRFGWHEIEGLEESR